MFVRLPPPPPRSIQQEWRGQSLKKDLSYLNPICNGFRTACHFRPDAKNQLSDATAALWVRFQTSLKNHHWAKWIMEWSNALVRQKKYNTCHFTNNNDDINIFVLPFENSLTDGAPPISGKNSFWTCYRAKHLYKIHVCIGPWKFCIPIIRQGCWYIFPVANQFNYSLLKSWKIWNM